MTFANSFTMLLSAFAPVLILILLGTIPSLHRKTQGAISATVLATVLALLVLLALIIAGHSFGSLRSITDSEILLPGLPLASFAIALGVLAHREKLSAMRVALCGAVGVTGLWWSGGFVAILSACGISPNGGC